MKESDEEDLLTKESLLIKFGLESNCNLKTACNLIILEHTNYQFNNPNVNDIIESSNDLLKGGGDGNLIIASYLLNSLEINGTI